MLIPQFFVIQLHLFNSPCSAACGFCCCCEILISVCSLLWRGEIECSANETCSSAIVKESVKQESFEFCDSDDENEDMDEDEELFCNPIGYTLLSCLWKIIWFNFFDSWSLDFFSIACLFAFTLDMFGKMRKNYIMLWSIWMIL